MPVKATKQTQIAEESPDRADLHYNNGRKILVVDDDTRVRQVTAKLLCNEGFDVCEACSGEEALEQLRIQGGAICLVLLDMFMPGMGGKRCLDEIRRHFGRLSVIVVSGSYDDYGLLGDGEDPADEVPFLPKPYRRKELVTAIDRALTSLH